MDTEVKKKNLGQFFTTNSDHILKGLEQFVVGKKIIDPFAGGRDLMIWARKNGAKNVSGFDVDEKLVGNGVELRDSLLTPTQYDFVVTNPPYLYVNKATAEIKKKYFERYTDFDDLYQISIASLMNSNEGIIIVPINFLSADNAGNIRRRFFEKFSIDNLNYFTYQVFPDTTYNVIAAHYRLKKASEENELRISMKVFFDDGHDEIRQILLRKEFGWGIGREVIEPVVSVANILGIYRFEDRNLQKGSHRARLADGHIKKIFEEAVSFETIQLLKENIILLKAIDSGSIAGRISLEDIRDYKLDGLVSRTTSRHMIQLIFRDSISISEQKELIKVFNSEFNDLREKTFSLFLTNYRDKNRKRVSFDFVYKMLNYLYQQKIQGIKAVPRQVGLPLSL